MRFKLIVVSCILAILLSLPAFATEGVTTEGETLPPPVFVAPGKEHLMHIKTTADGIRYSIREDGDIRIEGAQTTALHLVIPDRIDGAKVVEVAPAAFSGDGNITAITLPDSIVVVGKQAFENCVNLTSVKLPSTLRVIPERCFRACQALQKVTLPEALEEVGDSAFSGCTMLGELIVPASLHVIGDEAFLGCEQLILSCEENDFVQEYAEKHRIPTDFWETSNAQFLMLGAIAAGMGAVLVLGKWGLGKVLRKRK